MRVRKTSCCGLRELDYISGCIGPRDVILRMKKSKVFKKRRFVKYEDDGRTPVYTLDEVYPALLLFTGVEREGYGQKLEEFIVANNLGTVTRSETALNSNSDNTICAWIWKVNADGIKAFGKVEVSKESPCPATILE